MINERKLDIIKLILNKKRSIDEIGELLNVSSRTIRRDLIQVVEVVSEQGFVVEKDKKEYIIIDPNLELMKALNDDAAVDYTLEERIVVAFKQIAKGNLVIDIEQAANELFLPLASLKRELLSYLDDKEYQYSERGSKISFVLIDEQRRSMLLQVLRDYLKVLNIEQIILNCKLDIEMKKISEQISHYITLNTFTDLFIEIEDIFNEKNKYIPDFELVYIVIIGMLCQKQQYVHDLELPYSEELVTSAINEQICDVIELNNICEVSYFAKKLERIITELEYEKVSYDVINEVSLAIDEFEKELGFNLHDRKKLEYQVSTHNARVSDQDTSNVMENATLTSIVDSNLELYQVFRKTKYLSDLDGIKGIYVFIYFVMAVDETINSHPWNIIVICFGGVGTSLMIRKQLEKQYTNSNIQNLSYARALSGANGSADLLVANNNLPNDIQDEVVGHIVTSDDFKRINKTLLSRMNKTVVREYNDDYLINIGKELQVQDYLMSIGECLIEYVKGDLINDSDYLFAKLRKREQVGTGIPNSQIAFFHTRSSSVNKLLIESFITDEFTTKGIDGSQMECNQVLLVLVPSDISDKLLEKVNVLSYSLITEPKLLDAIETGNEELFKQVIEGK